MKGQVLVMRRQVCDWLRYFMDFWCALLEFATFFPCFSSGGAVFLNYEKRIQQTQAYGF